MSKGQFLNENKLPPLLGGCGLDRADYRSGVNPSSLAATLKSMEESLTAIMLDIRRHVQSVYNHLPYIDPGEQNA